MAANPCPKYASQEWKELTTKLGESSLPDIQQAKSMKLFMESGNSELAALQKLNPAYNPPRAKEERLRALSSRVRFVTKDPISGQPVHKYFDPAGNELMSVSRKLDEVEALAYRGDDRGALYADSGTAVHGIFEKYAAGEKMVNISKFAADNNIPESVVHYAASFIDSLRQTGIVLSEMNLRDPNLPIAGRADIIHLKNDGTVDLYDIKTAYRTPSKILGNQKIWNPAVDYDGYKAQRYSTQLEFYGQMIEKAIGHPVSNQYIIPIEVEFKDDLPSAGIANLNTLPTESTYNYGYENQARRHVNAAFGIKRTAPLPALARTDDSSDLLTKITGVIQNVSHDLDKQAESFFIKGSSQVRKTGGGYMQFKSGASQWTTFENQTDHTAQKQQIVKYLSRKEGSYRDLPPSIENYILTGKDAFLSTEGYAFDKLRSIMDRYRNRGFTVNSLSEVEGFEDKKNWIMIKKDDFTDLLYIGNEDLQRPFTVLRDSSALSKVFGADKSLFGNLGFSASDARHDLDSTLGNNLADAYKLEGAMIAMKLLSSNPTIRFDRILVQSIGSASSLSHHADLHELLPTLQKLFAHPNSEKFVPSTYRELVKDPKLFLPSSYSQDFAKGWLDLLGDTLDAADQRTLAGLRDYNQDKISRQELIGRLLNRIHSLRSSGKTDITTMEQARMLSEYVFQLRKVNTWAIPVGKRFERWASMPQNVANEIIQDLVLDFRNALSRVRTEFWENYKKSFNTATAALFRSSGSILSSVGDYTISSTTRYYEPLLGKKDFKVLKIVDGKQVEQTIRMATFDMLAEDSEDFAQRSVAEQEYIRKFNDVIQKGASLMNIDWERGRIPLLKSTFYNQFYKARQSQEGAYKGLLDRAFNSLEDSFANGFENNDDKPATLHNRFENQANNAVSDDKRQEMLGITPDGRIEVDKHSQYETNLEVIADTFMMEAIRIAEYNKTNKLFDAADSIFEWQKSGLFDGRFGVNLEFSKVWREAQIHMRNQGHGSPESKAVDTLNRVASLSLITPLAGLKGIGVGVKSFFSQQLSVFSQAMANSFASVFNSSTEDFGLGNWMKAAAIITNPKNAEKVNLLLDQYGLYNTSATDMTNGHLRYGNRSIFKLKYLYGVLNMADWYSRSQMMAAQMLKHDNWDAYSVVDGKLVYDQDRDGRFNGKTMDAAKGKALLEATKAELAEEGIQPTSDGRLTRAYAPHEAQYLKNLTDRIIGGFDRDSKALYGFSTLGRFLGIFQTWLPARLNAMFDSKFTSYINGHRDYVPDGKGGYTALWTGKQMEGIFQTCAYITWSLAKYRKFPYQKLTAHQQNNIRTLATHVAVITAITSMALLVSGEGDEEDEKWRADSANLLRNSLNDIMGSYNIFQYGKFLYTPVAIEFLTKGWKQTMNVLAGEKDITSERLQGLILKMPVVSAFDQMKEFVDENGEDR